MASLTYWYRIEPRPRERSLAAPLAARVRDPLWLLTRQWQVGEFRGEDAGSPAIAEVAGKLGSVLAWRTGDGVARPVALPTPLEALVENEERAPDVALRVQFGQTFAALLAQEDVPADVAAAFRSAYPVAAVPEAELAAMIDQEAARFLRVCGGRATDGVALYEAARAAAPELPAAPSVPDASADAVRRAVEAFLAWVEDVHGGVGADDPPAWDPSRLEYRVELVAASPDGEPIVFAAQPARDGAFDWAALDLRAGATADVDVPAGATGSFSVSVIPGSVRFRGMPNARWWSFESEATDFGAVVPDRRDVAKVVVMDFMLLHGNDWFVLPFDLPVGGVCRLDTVLVQDVFGELTAVERADAVEGAPEAQWTLFSTAIADDSTRVADLFLRAPSAAASAQTGDPLEEVRLFRDEMANMVWAIERTTENGIGRSWPGHERDLAARAAAEPPLPAPADGARAPLRYVIETEVPESWIPFLPVAVDPARREVILERSAMLRPGPDGSLVRVEPLGRILRPTSVGSDPYRLREEEVPRSGVRVARVPCRSRSVDGSTHVWISRRTLAGGCEGASGLRFDIAVPNE